MVPPIRLSPPTPIRNQDVFSEQLVEGSSSGSFLLVCHVVNKISYHSRIALTAGTLCYLACKKDPTFLWPVGMYSKPCENSNMGITAEATRVFEHKHILFAK